MLLVRSVCPFELFRLTCSSFVVCVLLSLARDVIIVLALICSVSFVVCLCPPYNISVFRYVFLSSLVVHYFVRPVFLVFLLAFLCVSVIVVFARFLFVSLRISTFLIVSCVSLLWFWLSLVMFVCLGLLLCRYFHSSVCMPFFIYQFVPSSFRHSFHLWFSFITSSCKRLFFCQSLVLTFDHYMLFLL